MPPAMYISKIKMELDIQVSKLKLLKAEHTSQKYRLEADIARHYPAEITALKERVAGLSSDCEMAAPVLAKEEGKDHFSMEIRGKEYTDRKEAGEAFLYACMGLGLGKLDEARPVGSVHGFTLTAFFNALSQQYMVSIGGKCSYRIEISRDALGNMQRISNALAKIPEELEKTRQELENVQRQLAIAKEEVEKPFAKEAELQEKLERLAELNVLLNMDEKSPAEAVGLDEEDREEGDIPDWDTEENLEEETAKGSVEEETEFSMHPDQEGEEQEGEADDEPEYPKELACRTEKGYFAIQASPGDMTIPFTGKITGWWTEGNMRIRTLICLPSMLCGSSLRQNGSVWTNASWRIMKNLWRRLRRWQGRIWKRSGQYLTVQERKRH